MKQIISIIACGTIMLITLAACSGDNSPLGKLPVIIADACKQQDEINEKAKHDKDRDSKLFVKAMEIQDEIYEKVLKEGERLKGKEIPSSAGKETYDFIKIDKVLIDRVQYDMRWNSVTVDIILVPTDDYNAHLVPEGSKIYYTAIDQGDNILKAYSCSYGYLTGRLIFGRSRPATLEQWMQFKEIKFITQKEYEKIPYKLR